MVFFSAFIFVLSILVFQVLLHEGKLRGTGALLAAVLVAVICCVAAVMFAGGVMSGG